jgi:hypothetical protein
MYAWICPVIRENKHYFLSVQKYFTNMTKLRGFIFKINFFFFVSYSLLFIVLLLSVPTTDTEPVILRTKAPVTLGNDFFIL